MTLSEHPVITISRGGAILMAVPMRKLKMSIGRSLANDVVLVEPGISRSHVEIERTPSGYIIRQVTTLGSIAVNGRRLDESEAVINTGDAISIGETGVEITLSLGVSQDLPVSPAPQLELKPATLPAPPIAIEVAAEAAEFKPPAPPEAAGKPPASAPDVQRSASDRLYEGSVLLDVRAEGKIDSVMSFVRQLRKSPDMRFMRMVNRPGGVEITLGVRQPIPVKRIIEAIEDVSVVEADMSQGTSGESRFLVELGRRA